MFYTEVKVEGISAGKGTGYSKKESQQNAARMALNKIKGDADFRQQIAEVKEANAQCPQENAQCSQEETSSEATPQA